MLLRCMSNVVAERSKHRYAVVPGGEYTALGIIGRGHEPLAVVHTDWFPAEVPLSCFEVVDARPSRWWSAEANADEYVVGVLSAVDGDFREHVLDGDELEVNNRYRQMVELLRLEHLLPACSAPVIAAPVPNELEIKSTAPATVGLLGMEALYRLCDGLEPSLSRATGGDKTMPHRIPPWWRLTIVELGRGFCLGPAALDYGSIFWPQRSVQEGAFERIHAEAAVLRASARMTELETSLAGWL